MSKDLPGISLVFCIYALSKCFFVLNVFTISAKRVFPRAPHKGALGSIGPYLCLTWVFAATNLCAGILDMVLPRQLPGLRARIRKGRSHHRAAALQLVGFFKVFIALLNERVSGTLVHRDAGACVAILCKS